MSRLWELECFDDSLPVSAADAVTAEGLVEEERLQAFDNGYKDGWDDAAKAHAEEQRAISAELATNLQALSFSYHEARNAVLNELQGILKGLVSRVLPETMVPSLGQIILERIRDAADHASNVPVHVYVSPDNVDRVGSLLEGMIAPPLKVQEEESLGDGQAFIRLGESEQKVDLEGVLAGLSEAVDEFFEEPQASKEAING